jgi:hypothetical protein
MLCFKVYSSITGREEARMITHSKHLHTHQRPEVVQQHSIWSRWKKRALLVFGTAVLAILGLVLWVHADPELVPKAVDVARAIVGPGPVAQVESWAFQLQDATRQMNYRATGAQLSVGWAAPVTSLPPTHRRTKAQSMLAQPAPPSSQSEAIPESMPATAGHTSVGPGNGPDQMLWSPYITTANGQPVLERALVTPDPERPYVRAALVRIDLQQTRLHLVAGTQEPASPIRVARTGRIPSADQERLIAAFNGGFKAVNGGFGMGVDGTTLLPPKDGLSTLAIYRDGSVRMGVWGVDIEQTPQLAAFRQNCPPLIEHGQISALAETDDASLWGKTVGNKIATWRSGLGLSADRRYLIYAVGDGLTVPTLARALVDAGAEQGMQLDINSGWPRFVTYMAPATGRAPVATKLLDTMIGGTRQFLTPDTRDFFYMTALS